VIKEFKQGMGETTWTEIGEHDNPIGMIPIVHIKNTEDDKLWGESDIEPVMTLVDAICKAFTDMVQTQTTRVFRGFSRPGTMKIIMTIKSKTNSKKSGQE